MAAVPSFAELAAAPDPPLDRLALALAAEFRLVDAGAALAALDVLADDVAGALRTQPDGSPAAAAQACAHVLGRRHGFTGDRERYDDPANSMLDVVLQRRRGLPILLSVVYVAVARRAGVPLAGVGLPGHFVVGHFGETPPVLLDPFNGGRRLGAADPAFVRPWGSQEIALRMLNNLLAAQERRGDVNGALRSARMRLALPAAPAVRAALERDLNALEARLN